MWVAELAQAIPPELGGGRRNHRPIELVLNYVLLNDVVRQKRKAIGIGSTDFLGCFDRLVHIIALLCLRLFGMPHAPVQSMIEAIQTMTHLIRTAFGDSTEGYQSNPTRNPHTGLLQGNAAAMAGNTVSVLCHCADDEIQRFWTKHVERLDLRSHQADLFQFC